MLGTASLDVTRVLAKALTISIRFKDEFRARPWPNFAALRNQEEEDLLVRKLLHVQG